MRRMNCENVSLKRMAVKIAFLIYREKFSATRAEKRKTVHLVATSIRLLFLFVLCKQMILFRSSREKISEKTQRKDTKQQ